MTSPDPCRTLALGCSAETCGQLGAEPLRSPMELLDLAPEADLVLLDEGLALEAESLLPRFRDTSPSALVALVRSQSRSIPRHPGLYDDLLLASSPDLDRRRKDLERLARMRRRYAASGLPVLVARAALDEHGLAPELVDEGGLLPPGRIPLASLHDVRQLDRQQRSICELMGTAFATFRFDHEPRALRDAGGSELPPTGTLAPYCAYLKGTGERSGQDLCLQSDWRVAERAFLGLEAAETVCAGGIGLFAVPITLRFGAIRAPLAAVVVATGPLPDERSAEAAAEAYGARPEILVQMASESRFWILHADKVGSLKESIRNLADSISLEVSHAYSTAYQAVSGLLRETDLRRSEEKLASQAVELREANRSLEEKQQEIQDFTHSVTHDLKKPLGAMKTMLSMLQRGYLGEMAEKQMRAVDTATEAAEYMIRLVQDLLESSRLDSGAATIDPTPVDPREILDRTVQRLRYQIEEKGIDLRIEPLPRVRADVDALEKIFMNLLGNAVSYIGGGEEKRITVKAERRDSRVVLIVEDTGIGIPDESRARIFEKFRRGTNVADTSGTGLGLAIVKGMVEAHGGQVVVDTEVGRGSTFRIDFAADSVTDFDLHPPPDGGRYGSATMPPDSEERTEAKSEST
jgi:signal transduction histidine kinase